MITNLDLMSNPLFVFGAIGLALLLYVARSLLLRGRLSLPPGPRGLPFLGNLFDLPKDNDWIHWATFKEKYGPISSVRVMGKTIIILNTLQACTDLLEKRSAKYSGRPILPFAGEIIGWNKQMILAPYGTVAFKTMRRMVYQIIGTKSSVAVFQQLQETETKEFLIRIFRDPGSLLRNLRLAQGSIFLKMSHGYNIRKNGPDPLIELVETAAKDFYVATTKVWLVDIFPWLHHMPRWLPFQRTAAKYRQTNLNQVELPHNFVKRQLNTKAASFIPSFTSEHLRSTLKPEEEEVLKYAASALYGGGTDAVTATLSTFFLAMVLFPDVQKKAQREIDEAIGPHRLPRFSDRERLPYLAAVYKEVLRWHVVGPMGIPHAAVTDDVYEGFLIPKGSIVLSNLWLIARDPQHYQDPTEFKPERFYSVNADKHTSLDPHNFAFGFGRRKCPGQELGDANVWICMAMSLSIFEFSDEGIEVPPRAEFTSGTVSHPKPFQCAIKPRSADAMNLLREIESEYSLEDDNASVL